jgi:hypothetical protein
MTTFIDSDLTIGLLAERIGTVDSLVTLSDLPLRSVDLSPLALPPYRCPYGLPAIDSGDIVLVTSWWLQTQRRSGLNVVKQVLRPLRERFRRVIGLDHADMFHPVFPDEYLSAMDVVLKMNGVYQDLELYNFLVGAPTPDGRWTEKTEPSHERFSLTNLQKFVPSIPCFLYISPQHRAMMRSFYRTSLVNRTARAFGDLLISRLVRSLPLNRSPCHTVHFIARLSHIQRLDTARQLRRSSLRWRGGITHIPDYVQGLGRVVVSNPCEDHKIDPATREALMTQLVAEDLLTPRLNRYQHMLMMRDCKAVLSIVGYGELGFQMAEAWASRRVLVCQDLSHVRTLFPFAPGRNVVYCRPDLTDLIDILDDIECNYRNYIPIAEQGYRDWLEWSRDVRAVIRQRFAPLYERVPPL